MILKALKYKDSFLATNWSIASGTTYKEFVEFENINLIVGRNASGKTRFIDSLSLISDLFEGSINVDELGGERDISLEVLFENNRDEIEYLLEFNRQEAIQKESLFINDELKLDRSEGKLYYETLNDYLDFYTDSNFLAISRRDSLQQPFFEILHNWGKKLSHYSFGSNMGKELFVDKNANDSDRDITNFKNTNRVIEIYKKGKTEYGELFERKIIDDMKGIEYDLSSVSLVDVSKYLFLSVQESDLPFEINFDNMSQGMARAFSLIVQLNYSIMAKIPSCILIDDIGEGLDYDRSKKLIELIIEKAEGSNIQIFMTTNDRFVMNSVPLKYWSVIHREANKSIFYNYQNSKQTFDDFAFTGLNNFDFFATDFYRLGFEEFTETA